jgi:hypothetical protein
MFRKILVMAIAGMIINLATAQFAFAETKEEKFTAKVRTGVIKLGTGPNAKIQVKLKDKTKIKGYIIESNQTEFLVMNAKTGEAVPVAYPAVKQVRGNNVSTGVKIAIYAALIFAAILIVTVIAGSQLD